MIESKKARVKRAFLISLIISVALCALLGIMAILSRQFGWFEVRILLTAVTVAGASVCGLACGAFLTARRAEGLPLAGIFLALLGAVMVIAGMWLEIHSEAYWKLAACACVFAVACAHMSLLSLANLTEDYSWSLIVAYLAIFGVASLIAVMILMETHGAGMFQLMGVAAIIDAAITIIIPIFHKLSKPELSKKGDEEPESQIAAINSEIARLKARIEELERLKQQRASAEA